MKILRLLKQSPPLNVGEIAGFDDDAADRMITCGDAELYVEPSPASQAIPAEPPRAGVATTTSAQSMPAKPGHTKP